MIQIDGMHSSEEKNTIQANPLLGTLSILVVLQIFTIILFLALIIYWLIDLVFERETLISSYSGPMYLFMCMLVQSIFMLIMNKRQFCYWKKVEQQRFAAAQGGRALPAAEQPILKVEPIWQPGTLRLRFSKKPWLVIVSLLSLAALLLAGFISFEASLLFTFSVVTPYFFLVCFCISVLALLVLLLMLLPYSANRQNIRLTEYGITTRYAGKTAAVMWSEARLFAFYETLDVQKSGTSITYELSSAANIVRWTWIQGRTRFISQEPVDPQDEYNHQMQGLLALIQQRTGLTLYDLRQRSEE